LVFSDWRIDLLAAVEETGSLAAAAERLGVHYRRAWGKVKEMEERLGVPLIVTQSGGVGGGGAYLTPQAKEYIRRYKKFRQGLKELVDRRFKEAFQE